MRKHIILAVVLVLLAGCGSGDGSFSKDDLCIVKIESDQKVCYGDSRSDAENVVGKGESNVFGWFKYADGVSLGYRDDKVVMLTLEGESQGAYKTVKGASIGDSKVDIMKIYGEYAIELGEKNLDYIYDSINETYLDEGPEGVTAEEREAIYHVLSALFDSDGYASTIMILDNRMATFLE